MSLAPSVPWNIRLQLHKRSVVREILADVARSGCPAGCDIILTFSSRCPGVSLPVCTDSLPVTSSLALKPGHFWNLQVNYFFSAMELIFNDQKKSVRIPFIAITQLRVSGALEYTVTIEPATEECMNAIPTCAEGVLVLPQGQ